MLEVLVGIRTSVQGLDVGRVKVESGSGIFDYLVPVAERIIAGGAVGEEDGVRLAEDSLGVEVDGIVVVLAAVGLVASSLELKSILLELFGREALDGLGSDLRELIGALDRGGRGCFLLGLCRRGLFNV